MLQLPDYSNLGETGRYRIQWGKRLQGLCCYNQRLFTVERLALSVCLCMYQVTVNGLELLDIVTVVVDSWYPRVDGHSQQVYIPRGVSHGVSVVSWEDNQLTPQPALECVGCYSVGVMSPDTLCVCDSDSGSISLVSVKDDTVTATLEKPVGLRDMKPHRIAVLHDRLLVRYGSEGHNLVLYENGISPGTTAPWPTGMHSVCSMSSDGVSRFLICDRDFNAVYTLDVTRRLVDKINIDTDSEIEDCAVVDGELWVGCVSGDIVVMSPQ